MSTLYDYFDKLEDHIRARLSRSPILYAFIGGVGIVLFWRGVWMVADLFAWMTGPVTLVLSSILLLLIGLFVSYFIGDNIIIGGIKGEKKLIEKVEHEAREEIVELGDIAVKLDRIERELHDVRRMLHR